MRINVTGRNWMAAWAVALAALLGPSKLWAAGCPGSGGQSQGQDVIVGGAAVDGDTPSYNYNGVANYSIVTISGVTYDTFSMGTTSCNYGNLPLKWYSNTNEHPVVSQNFFRLKNVNGARRFEQLGQAWVKHGFCALRETLCCTSCTAQCSNPCSNTTCLGVGCSDPYTASRNGSQTANRGPKYSVNATTGINPMSVSTSSGNSVKYRFHIPVSELEVSAGTGGLDVTRYFGECMYVDAEDAAANNKNNNASYRAIGTAVNAGEWTFRAAFSASNTTQAQKAGIRAWVDTDTTPSTPGTITRVVETDVITPENSGATALVIVGAQATYLGNNLWHYEYAVENISSDRSIYSFSIPVDSSANVTNIGFHDVDYWDGDGVNAAGVGGTNYDGTDWPGVFSGGTVTWTCAHTYAVHQGANAIRWATMYNFRFDCDFAPSFHGGDVVLGQATMVQFKPGAQTITGDTVVPSVPTCVPPSVDPISNATVACGASFTSSTPSTSSGSAPLSWTIAGAPAGMTINPNTGVVSWSAPLTGGSPYSLTSTATNSCGNSSQNWTLTVNPNAPSIDPIANANAVCGATYVSTTPTTSGGVAPLAWSLSSGPAGATIDGSTGVVTWPSPVATGSPFTITVQADSANSCGTSSPQSWQVGVVVGDFDADGLVTESDIPGFVDDLLLDNPICAGDINGDGYVDGNDVPAFDAALGV